MRTCTLTLALPWAARTSSHTIRGVNHRTIAKTIARTIDSFAARHRVAPLAVEYEIAWSAGR